MQTIFFILVALTALAVLVFSAAAISRHSRSRDEAFQRLAEKLGGSSYTGGLFTNPSVQFLYKGIAVQVDTHQTGGKNPKHYIHFNIHWHQRDIRCEIYPDGFFTRLIKLLGMEDINIGSPQFDRDYVISGGTPNKLRNLLSPKAQELINSLRALWNNQEIYILISNGLLLIKKRGRIGNYDDLFQFTSLSAQLFEAMRVGHEEGVTFIAPEKSPVSEEKICQICGEQITKEIVYCRSCKTPHHLDCWKYYGACSTYACGATRYVVPRKKKRAKKS